MAAARYVALNPARARLVSRAQDWRWSSVRAHLDQRDDGLVNVAPLLDRCNGRFVDLMDHPAANKAMAALRGAETIGRPLGSPAFLDRLAALTGRDQRNPPLLKSNTLGFRKNRKISFSTYESAKSGKRPM